MMRFCLEIERNAQRVSDFAALWRSSDPFPTDSARQGYPESGYRQRSKGGLSQEHEHERLPLPELWKMPALRSAEGRAGAGVRAVHPDVPDLPEHEPVDADLADRSDPDDHL